MEKRGFEVLDSYKLNVQNEIIDIHVVRNNDGFSFYKIAVKNISKTTEIVLEKIREEFVSQMNVSTSKENKEEIAKEDIKDKFRREIKVLIDKYFPKTDQKTADLLINHLMRQSVGLGDVEILLKDNQLEEIAINNSTDPVWVYHIKHGWLMTNVKIPTESRIRHFATMIGRDIGKEITLLKPLMDAHLLSGDRVNATLNPISTKGNTITIRKFATKPWTITDFLSANTMTYEAAALIWLAVQNELSALITGGTGSGKTSMLNVVCSFIPLKQRIISIEDTRELTLPKDLHWVPLETRLPNPEGKGEVSMLDLVVNSLRMRPDRIIMGEIRRKREAEVLFEAMHTGHSVYGTLHANNVEETIQRLTNPPINVPKNLLGAISLIIVQNRNRKTGKRRTLQIAEVLPNGDAKMLMQYNVVKDTVEKVGEAKQLLDTLNLYTGMTKKDIEEDLAEKITLLKWLVKNKVNDIHEVGTVLRKYYVSKGI